MAVTLNKANLVLKDANGNIGKIEQLSDRDLAKIKTAVSDVALVVNQSNHTPIEATTTNKGVVQLATPADVVSGASDKVVTAEQLHNSTTGTSALATENLARIDAVVTEAGISVDHTNTNQLKTAVTTLISNATPATATANTLGVVKPDNDTITIDSNGVLTATAQMPGVATNATVGVVKPDNDTITVGADGTLTATAQMPGVATTTNVGVVKPDNDTITVGADGTLTATAQMPGVATTTNVGVVKPDGTTITVDSDGTLTCGGKDLVRSVNGVGADENGNVKLGTEKSTFNKVVFDTGYFKISTEKSYSFDLTGSDLENVSKENVNIRIVAKVITAHDGFEVGDIAQLTPAIDHGYSNGNLDVCAYIHGNTLYVYSGSSIVLSIHNGTDYLQKAYVQIKAVLTAFIPDDGSILLIAEDQTNTSKLIGLPDGTLTWGGKTIAPVTGKIEWFAFNEAPDGYLVCNGASVSRETYADLFTVIGTTFGSGDGSTTFTLPNLIDKFAQGSTTVGTVKNAGLPNIIGHIGHLAMDGNYVFDGAFSLAESKSLPNQTGTSRHNYAVGAFYADRSNSIYGNSTTVQPPALTLLPCIKY